MNIFELLDGPIPHPELVAVGPTEPPPEVIGRRMSESEIIELWEERSAIQQTDNRQLVDWWQSLDRPPISLRRYCDLIAAADLSLTYGTYIEPIVRPMIARG